MFGREFGSKPGSGGVMSASQANVHRNERMRQLALETMDLSKDPYFSRNHVGFFECKLCLTQHRTEGNYLAHTQGHKHQKNLRLRQHQETLRSGGGDGTKGDGQHSAAALSAAARARRARLLAQQKKAARIGRPGYKVTKQRDAITGQRSLLFEIHYPEISDEVQPRHRFMSAYEQRVEVADPRWQYLLFAAEPYETIAFKIPNRPIIRERDLPTSLRTRWDRDALVFSLHLHFVLMPNDRLDQSTDEMQLDGEDEHGDLAEVEVQDEGVTSNPLAPPS
mmetsp:Transcript_18602/g.47276  ORF Transcript_18602/g.47276 Transcript_18602/m.47276 type:complete len:279 (+) Transcript_18602:88-924(+)|eukprot:CAMPEP_0177660388 /NCGR_PEP_ID=MMETSP0447-20121125/18011_1 /TAXON_ID=0 /ORGANISM="Stygamoeba regulata, Strain BSH-02190019" /LENGTH=278 /DNA_ID=CAMNT_0019165445 /DNA_START=48 /DNA_END=884 /DNA_ORIENTATION=+